MKKIGNNTYIPAYPVTVKEWQAIVGQKEKEGPLGKYFDLYSDDEYFGQETYEKAEAQMQKEAVDRVYQKANCRDEDIDFIFAGDLLNQCVSSAYGSRDRGVGYFGLYGACSTVIEASIIASMAIDGGFASQALAVTSSHFCTAERQYRYPLDYGSLRPPSAQWTVTGAGCLLLTNETLNGMPKISAFCPGTIVDMGISDINNMGAAMAPAAADTLKKFFDDTRSSPDDYDLIVTGDLGSIGHELVKNLLGRENITLGANYLDCGMMIFDADKQDVHAGGSGCGCCASVLAAYILPMMRTGLYKNVLVAATGALMSPTMNQQGESIPAISHLIRLTV